MDRHVGGFGQRERERVAESHPCGSLSYFYVAFLPDFLSSIILICLGSQSIFGRSQGLPMCAHTSLSQDGVYRKGVWVEYLLT